ncbi:alpha-hydroxy acid oxidase [Streptomyces syringium]|uniref:alpha-hydroxy acid oxidase n=1 Tax=Streptomyces syringium TaxID=76729 RepID=UPI0034515ECD
MPTEPDPVPEPAAARPAPVTLDDYRTAAQALVDPAAWGYIEGGSGAETTLRESEAAYRRYRLRPRVLVDVSHCDLRTTLLGSPVELPVAIAPMAYHGLVSPEAEPGTVRAAAAAGALTVVSTFAGTPLEEIAEAAAGAPLWMQLYVFRDRATTEALVRRAEAAGYRALVVTVDTPRVPRRARDLRNAFSLPPGMVPANFDDRHASGLQQASQGASVIGAHAARHHDAAFGWDDLAWLRSLTALPLVLKGVLTGEDAARAAELGVEGIVVSNHGGRQLDGAVPALEALPEVVAAVAGRCEVYVDGGVRRGTDVLTALALGARAVLLGRPVLWGLAVAGSAGARDVLSVLRAELEDAMALSGRPDLASLDAGLLRPCDTPVGPAASLSSVSEALHRTPSKESTPR